MKNCQFQSLKQAGFFLKQQIEQDLQRQIKLHDHAVLILPGGNSIKLFFPYLTSLDVPWNKITIGLSDERCVPLDHKMSNEKQLRECFLDLLPDYNYCPLNQQLITKIQEFPPVTVLSMGEDGHLASLFPEEYEEWKDMIIGVYKTKNKSPDRVSLSEIALMCSQVIYILAVGKDKNHFLDEITKSSFCLNSIYKNSYLIRVTNAK